MNREAPPFAYSERGRFLFSRRDISLHKINGTLATRILYAMASMALPSGRACVVFFYNRVPFYGTYYNFNTTRIYYFV